MDVQNVQHRLGRVRTVRIVGVAVGLRRGTLAAAARVSGYDFRRCVAHVDAVPFNSTEFGVVGCSVKARCCIHTFGEC